MTCVAKKPSGNWRPAAIGGAIVIAITFGVFGGWSAVAKLDSAVVAMGTVAVESNRKTLQHLEGGIVRSIDVTEGDQVQKGQVLLRLDDTTPKANVDLLSRQLASIRAQEARLIAERDQKEHIDLPSDVLDLRDDPMVDDTIKDQTRQFEERRRTLASQMDVLQSRIAQYREEIDGMKLDREANMKQVDFIDQELVGMNDLLKKSLIPVTRVYAHERERARLSGLIGRSTAEIAKAEGAISEITLQMTQLKQKFREDVAGNLVDVRNKLSEVTGRLNVARDVLSRTVLTAPESGTVQNLKVWTIGQVIRNGEALLEIVPNDEPLIVHAQISPQDINVVSDGLVAEIRFPSFHSRTTPILYGKIDRVSRDRLIDEASRQPYFLALVSVDRTALPPDINHRLTAGMPAELIISTGERTVLEYIAQPLTAALHKVGREQ